MPELTILQTVAAIVLGQVALVALGTGAVYLILRLGERNEEQK